MADLSQYDKYINEASETYGVSTTMIKAIIKVESDGNSNAVSKAGAKGLMQLMPSTFATVSDGDIMNPRDNIMAGTKYYKKLLDANNGDVEKALACYNGGSGNVAKYGKEKYSKYYNKVLSFAKEKDDSSTTESANTKWWGDIVVVVFIIIIFLIGVILFSMSVTGFSPKKEVKKIKNKKKGGSKNATGRNGKH